MEKNWKCLSDISESLLLLFYSLKWKRHASNIDQIRLPCLINRRALDFVLLYLFAFCGHKTIKRAINISTI